jgi:hypothetical protein
MALRLTGAEESPGDRPDSPAPRYTKRLSDKILMAFHQACDQQDTEVALDLLTVLEFMAMRHRAPRADRDRRARESLVAAHERLWQIRHPSWRDDAAAEGHILPWKPPA